MQRRFVHASLSAAVAVAIFPATALAARVDYNFDIGSEWNDNVALSSTNPIDQRYLRSGLGFAVTETNSTLQARVDGRVEYRNYEDNIFSDTIDGNLSGKLNWIISPQRLFMTVEDNLAVQPVDALVPDAPGNRQQVNVFSTGPTFLFNWSQSFQGQAELRYINSDAEVTDEFNSQRVALALRSIKELTPTSRISLNVQGQRVDFDDDIVARDYDRYDLFARYSRTLAHFEIGVDAGYSTLDYTSGGSRSDPLFRVDATWNPDVRNRLVVSAASQFSDTATDALATIEPGATLPENVLTGDAVINASPYRVRSLDVEYGYTATRFNFLIAPYLQNRDYVDTNTFDQDTHGVRADFNLLVRRSLNLRVFATDERQDYTQLDRVDKTTRFGAALRYRIARKWSAAVQAEHYKRDSDAVGQSVSQTIYYLSLSYTNR